MTVPMTSLPGAVRVTGAGSEGQPGNLLIDSQAGRQTVAVSGVSHEPLEFDIPDGLVRLVYIPLTDPVCCPRI